VGDAPARRQQRRALRPLAHRHLRFTAEGTVQRYTFGPSYRSGYIHHATLTGLEYGYGTRYSYRIGFGYAVRTFSFKTPPKPAPDAPFKFGVGEFRKTRHPRNVKFDKVLETCFSGAGNSRFSEAWNL
jgi:hypothetical protein